MKKPFKIFLIMILALFLIYQVYDFFWQRNRELAIKQSIVAMQNSVDELTTFCKNNAEDVEYLVAKSIEKNIAIYKDSIDPMKQGETVDVEPELIPKRDNLFTALPDNVQSFDISPSGMYIRIKEESFETLHIMVTSPPFTKDYKSYTAGNIGTIELEHTWHIDIGVIDPYDRERARKIFAKWNELT